MKLRILVLILLLILLCSQSDLTPKMRNQYKGTQYVIEYNDSLKIPTTVYYIIKNSKLGNYGRFEFHKSLNSDKTANPSDYYYSGYDKGHMMSSASATSKESDYESFDMINILPQSPGLNRGLWKMTEVFERNNSKPYCYIICGIIPSDSTSWMHDILIPYKFYKAIYNPKIGMIGFILSQYDAGGYLEEYAVPIDTIESLINKDLFYQLPYPLQKRLESSILLSSWKFTR